MTLLINQSEMEWNGELSPDIKLSVLSNYLLIHTPEGTFSALADKQKEKILISFRGRVYEIKKKNAHKSQAKTHKGEFFAPMPGQIVDIFVKPGSTVKQGEKLLVLEAMKTQHLITAPFEGFIVQIPIKLTQQVKEGDLLIDIEPVTL